MDNKPPKSQEPEHNKPESSESVSPDISTEAHAEPHQSLADDKPAKDSQPENSAKNEAVTGSAVETDTQPIDKASPQHSENSTAATVQNNRKGSSLLIIICLLLSLLALAAGGYLYFQLQQQQTLLTQQLAQQDNALQQALAAPQSQLNNLAQRQQQLDTSLSQLQQLPAQQRELSDRLATLAKRSPSHWQAAEANYLVTMAGRKLWLENDPLTAAGLLEAADERIAAMKDPALLPLRKALAKDIAAVKSIKQVDIAGTVFTLDEIISNLDKLPLNRADAQAGKIPGEDNNKLSDSVDDWQTNLSKTWKALLDDFIVVRHRTTDIAPLLTPDEQWYLVENIRSKLLQAQLALYRGDEINYRNSLQMAYDWMYQYYDLSSAEVDAALKVIKAMETVKLTPIGLTRFDSANMLKHLTEQGELQQPAGETL